MTESWDEYTKRKRKEFGAPEPDIELILPKPRCIKPPEKVKPPERRFNIHKRSIPPGIDGIVMYNIESKEKAERIIERTTDKQGNRIFSTRLYKNEAIEIDTYVFYKPIPTDATPRERSINSNPGDIVMMPIPGYKGPTRVN